MSFLTRDDLAEIEGVLRRQPPAPAQAPLGTQLTRGAISGLTLGMARPYAEAGAGGLPETLANLAGGLVGFAAPLRLAGVGVAGLGRIAPKLLAAAPEVGRLAAANEAMRKIALSPNLYKGTLEPLSPGLTGGRGAAMGLATAGAALAPEMGEAEPRTLSERL